MRLYSKGIAQGFLVQIIFVVLIVMMLFIVFFYVISKFGGGDFCMVRFEGEVNKLIKEASTTYGSSVTYTSFKIESCIKDVYYAREKGICYTYVDDEPKTKDCQKPIKTVYFQQAGVLSPVEVGFVDCGSQSKPLKEGYYTVKVAENTVTCQR